MIFYYDKLRGRIVEKYRTMGRFSEAMGLSRSSISMKLNGTTDWRQKEIVRACELLDLSKDDIPRFFFFTKS